MRHRFLTPVLLLAALLTFAQAASGVPVYLAPGQPFPSGNYNRDWLRERTKEQINQRWTKIRTRLGKIGWVASSDVLTRESLKNGWFAFCKDTVSLRVSPIVRSDFLATLQPGEKLTVVKAQAPAGWVALKRGEVFGYVPRNSVILADDIKSGAALSLVSQLPLLKQSQPASEPVARVEKFEEVKALDSRTEAWGRVSLLHGGSVWWPMTGIEADRAEKKPATLQLLSSQLFQRKLYDMAASPLSPELKLASAEGIFKTTDGREWTKLVQFKNENHPIAVSPLGRIFVGPYYSDDNGNTFTEYIRWDTLITKLREAWHVQNGKGIRLIEIHPGQGSIDALELLLDVGLPNKVTVSTTDLGANWFARPLL